MRVLNQSVSSSSMSPADFLESNKGNKLSLGRANPSGESRYLPNASADRRKESFAVSDGACGNILAPMMTARVPSGEGESFFIVLPLLLGSQGLDNFCRVVSANVFQHDVTILPDGDLCPGTLQVCGESAS